MPEHQKVQKRSQKIHSIQDKRRNMQKESAEITMMNDFDSCRTVDRNKMADAELAAELQEPQAGEERRGSDASQAVDCCLETLVEQIFAMGTDQARSKFDAMCQWKRRRKKEYHAARNQFERFRGFWGLISRFEFDFRRCGFFLNDSNF